MKRFRNGVVIGKFLPPHLGHRFLIGTALSQCENLAVIICEKVSDSIRGEIRAAWLSEMFPAARVMVIDDWYQNDDDSALWARLTIGWLGFVPDAAFTSEHYGTTWAREMGCAHVLVDLERQTVPVSATKIRADAWANWDYLAPPVRAHFAKRVVVLGAESTGTTTLARDLAAHFETNWVAEYGREYCETRNIGADYGWKSEEFTHIARDQLRRENEAAREANKILICDTDAWTTRLWHRRYLGFFSPAVDEIAFSRRPDLVLLTGAEIPFVQDGWRDGEMIRGAMHLQFIEELKKQNVPWQLVNGTREQRRQIAVEAIERMKDAAQMENRDKFLANKLPTLPSDAPSPTGKMEKLL